jgi:hypothetical protein
VVFKDNISASKSIIFCYSNLCTQIITLFVKNSEGKISIWESDGTSSNTKLIINIELPNGKVTNVRKVIGTESFLVFEYFTSDISWEFKNYQYLLNLTNKTIQETKIIDFKNRFIISESEEIFYEVVRDSAKFYKNDWKTNQITEIKSNDRFFTSYLYSQTIFFVNTQNKDTKYLLRKNNQSYSLHKIDLQKNEISFIKDIGKEYIRSMPFDKIVDNKIFYLVDENPRNGTSYSLKSLDLGTLNVKNLKTWNFDGFNQSPNRTHTYFDFDNSKPIPLLLVDGKFIINFTNSNANQNFQKSTESVILDINTGNSQKISGFIVGTDEYQVLSKNTVLLRSSYDSLSFRSELSLLDLNNVKITTLEKIDKGRNNFTSAELKDYLVFWKANQSGGTDIYSSNGTKEGTKHIYTINIGSVINFVVTNNRLFLVVITAEKDQSGKLKSKLVVYTTGGTAETTNLTGDLTKNTDNTWHNLFTYRNKVYFESISPFNKKGFLVSDGFKINSWYDNPLGYVSGVYPSVNQDYLYIQETQYIFSSQYTSSYQTRYLYYKLSDLGEKPILLFSSEILDNNVYSGIVNGTINPIIFSRVKDKYQLINKEGEILITISQESKNVELFKTNNIGQYSFFYFRDKKSQEITEVWQTDGTSKNTRVVNEPKIYKILLNSGSYDESGRQKIGFFYINHNNKVEQWISDGTEAGTAKIEDEREIYRLYPDRKVFVAPTTKLYEKALWISDGTLNGTRKVYDGLKSFSNVGNYKSFSESDDFFVINDDNIKIVSYNIKKDSLKIHQLPYKTNNNIALSFKMGGIINNNFLFLANDKTISMQLWRLSLAENLIKEDDKQDNPVSVFPNPIGNEPILNLNYQSPSDKIEVYIHDFWGRLINETEFRHPYPERMMIDVNNLNKGVYFITIKDQNQVKTKRFMKL